MSILTYIIGCPLAAALVLLLVPRQQRVAVRALAIGSTLVTLLFAVRMFLAFDPAREGFQMVQEAAWVPALGIQYLVGVDGINVGLILMGAIVAFAAACVSWEIRSREKEFYLLLLLMSGGILGAFASLDLFFFYAFHELALIPTFIMIGVWGRGERRTYAAFQMTIYLSAGALLALAGLIVLYVSSGAQSSSIPALTAQLQQHPLEARVQSLWFPITMFGFGILVSLWPFHTWAPLGYSAAPTPTAMLHAGVLKKFGLYALLRIAVPFMPGAAREWLGILAWLCVGNIVYCGLVALRQRDLNLLIGNSSVAHMGFAFLGIASWNLLGLTGAVYVMIAHGLLAALAFAISGYIYQQTQTLEFERLGGLLRALPFIGTALVMAFLAGCGVPGFGNFVGELMVFFGAWKPWTAVAGLALWGALLIGAVYMLRALRTVVHGPLPAHLAEVKDASNWWRRMPFILLLAALLGLGCFPRLMTQRIEPAVNAILKSTP
jgi:NADH-quinone oxidoreductase subunit M